MKSDYFTQVATTKISVPRTARIPIVLNTFYQSTPRIFSIEQQKSEHEGE